jgi:nitroreductase
MRRFIILLGVVACIAPAWADSGAEPLDVLAAIAKRTSIRKWEPRESRPVTDAELDKIIAAAFNGPRSSIKVVKIKDPKTIEQLYGYTEYGKWGKEAPAAIAVVVDKSESNYKRKGASFVVRATYAAMSIGLGTTFQGTANRLAMQQILGIGPDQHLVTVLGVGEPKKDMSFKSPPRASLEQIVWDNFKPATRLAALQPLERSGMTLAAFLNKPTSSVTAFDPTKPVDERIERTALEAARLAMSSKNRQPSDHLRITNKSLIERIAKWVDDPALRKAPVLYVQIGTNKPRPDSFGTQLKNDPHNTRVVAPGKVPPYYFFDEDVAIARTQFEMAASALGVGTRVKDVNGMRGSRKMAKTLHVPKNFKIVSVIGLGYASKTTSTPVSLAGRVFNEKWKKF